MFGLAHLQSGPGMLTTRAEFYCTKTWNYSRVNFQPNTPVKSKLLIIIYQREGRTSQYHIDKAISPFPLKLWHPGTSDTLTLRTRSGQNSNLKRFYVSYLRTKKWFILSDRFWGKLNENLRWWAWKLQRNFFWCWLDKFNSKGRGASSHFTKQRFYFININDKC